MADVRPSWLFRPPSGRTTCTGARRQFSVCGSSLRLFQPPTWQRLMLRRGESRRSKSSDESPHSESPFRRVMVRSSGRARNYSGAGGITPRLLLIKKSRATRGKGPALPGSRRESRARRFSPRRVRPSRRGLVRGSSRGPEGRIRGAFPLSASAFWLAVSTPPNCPVRN